MPACNVSKEIIIEKDPETVFATVRNFKTWPIWSPWLPADPDCEVSFANDGLSYSWDGQIAGAGSLTIVEDVPGKSMKCDLVFLKPWKSRADVELFFEPVGAATKVVWTMKSSLPIFMFFLKKMMVAMIGMDYERGLLKLKDLLELGEVPSKLAFGPSKVEGFSYIGLRGGCSVDDISESMEVDFGHLEAQCREKGLSPSGPPFSIYHKWDIVKGNAEYTIGFPLDSEPTNLDQNFLSCEMPSLRTYSVTHTGAYRHLGNAWSGGVMHGRAKQFSQKRGIHPFEIYENDPGEVDEKDLITVVHFPTK